MDGDESESFKKFKNDVKNTAKNGIILSGVLAWVDIQTHTTAEGVRQQQMASLFTLEEIEEAVEDLWGACGGQDSIIGAIPKRNNVANKAKNLVDDVFKAFKKLEEHDKKPAILATSVQLRKIRTYNVDDSLVNTSDVMERVKMLEGCISDQNKTITNLVTKFDSLSQSNSPALVPPPLSGVRPPPLRGAAGGPQQSRLSNLLNKAYNRDIRTPKRRRENEDEPMTNNGDEDSWATIAGRNRNMETQQVTGQGQRQNMGQGFTPRTHWRKKSLIANGSSNANSDDKSFAAVVCLVAGGVSKNATTDKLIEYLKNKGLNIVKCDLLTNPSVIDRVRSLSFKITIKAEDLEVASNPALWPYRVVVRRFVNFRKKIEDEFAPHPSGFAGVQPLGHPQISQQQLSHSQQTPLTPLGRDVVAVSNRFNVPGFRDGVSH